MPRVRVVKGDITEQHVDAIVNPANSLMLMGGGVAGAIKRKGGEVIEREARKHAPVPVGKAVATTAGKLPAKYVIHAPTMEEPGMRTTFDKVVKAIIAALRVARDLGVKKLAFPGMGTGVGGLTPEEGARAFVEAFRRFSQEGGFRGWDVEILLVAFTDDLYEAFTKVVAELEKLG